VTEAAAERADRLERTLGDPFDPRGPVGFAAVISADERREPVSGAARLLDEFGLNAELVPTELGGLLRDVRGLIEVMRALARRDPSLALAHFGMPLVGAVGLWTRGHDEQRRAAAELLLGGGRLTAAFRWDPACHELPRLDFGCARSGRVTLTGRCALVADADRADAVLMPARVDPAARGRDREWLLVDLAAAPSGTVEHLGRLRTVGLTGVRFAGVEFHSLRLPADSVLDRERQDDCPGEDAAAGTGAMILRTALPAIALAGLDTALRLTFHHLRTRPLYGGAASDLPAIRSLLARTFVDLMACDCLATAAARMISRLPAQAELYSLASLCFTADVVPSAMYRLSVGLGAGFYVRDGSSGMFQKLLRDLKPLGLDWAVVAAARLALVEATSSSRSLDNKPLPREVFHAPPGAEADEPPLSLRRAPSCREPWRAGTVRDALAHAAAEPDLRDLAALFKRLERDRSELTERLLRDRPLAVGSPVPAGQAKRLARLFAASACAGTWLHHRNTDRFLGAPTWLRGALETLLEPGGLGDAPFPHDVEAALYTELSSRCEQARSLGLAARQLA
jgi:alkylation response protein AidB-like acyl-CoA dehydrogenase